jgi:hypothetical protein
MTGDEHEHLAKYASQLADRLEQVVLDAAIKRQPCRLAYTQGSVDFAANRRVLTDGKWSGFGAVPDAPVDHALPAIRVTDQDGKVIALIANYACHNTTLRGNFKRIHGDWAACAQRFIEADHPGIVAMTTVGCGADSDPCPHGTVELCEQHGRALADEAKRLLKSDWNLISSTLTARKTVLEIPYQTPPSLDELATNSKRSYTLSRILEQLKQGEELPEAETHRVVTWTFGNDLAIVFFSDEVVVDYALRLKRELDANRLWVSAYTDDVSRYIVSKRLINEGGYEVRNSLSTLVSFGRPETLTPPMEDRIVNAVKSLLPKSFHSPQQANAAPTERR